MGDVRPIAKNGSKKGQREGDKWENLFLDKGSGRITWNDCDPQSLLDAVAAATEDGAAVLLSKTSDGGALVVRILTDQGSTPFYPASAAALSEVLAMIVEVAGKA